MTDGKVDMDAALRQLLTTGEYSDMVIRCGMYEFKVHRAIIRSRSTYFKTALKGNTFKEAREGIITLKATTKDEKEADYLDADDPEAVKLMVNFLYYHDYKPQSIIIAAKDANEDSEPGTPVTTNNGNYYYGSLAQSKKETKAALTPSGDCNTLMHTKMYALGEKYGIESLKSVALGKFSEAVTYAWNHPNFAPTIKLVFSTTPDHDKGLRDLTMQAILQHRGVLSKKDDIEATIKSIESLAYGLWKGTAITVSKGPTCNKCRKLRTTNCQYCGNYYTACDCGLGSCGRCGHNMNGY